MRNLIILLVAFMAGPVAAQGWFTKEVCFVEDPTVFPDAFSPFSYEQIQKTAKTIPNGDGKLWRITSTNGQVSYLWGTIHSNDPTLLALPEQVEDAIKRARVVAVERDLKFPDRRMVKASNSEWEWRYHISGTPDFYSLDLPTDLRKWVESRFDSLGWDVGEVNLLRLSVIAEILLNDACNDFNGWVYPIQDDRIQMLGDISGASTLGLEHRYDIRRRLEDGQSLKLNEALIAIYGAYLQPVDNNKGRSTFYALYLQGRIGEMMAWDSAYITDLFPDGQGRDWLTLSDEYLLAERNRNFVQSALDDLRTGGLFMAVGAFHLPGENGLVEMLRSEGFMVGRVPLPEEVPE